MSIEICGLCAEISVNFERGPYIMRMLKTTSALLLCTECACSNYLLATNDELKSRILASWLIGIAILEGEWVCHEYN